MNDASFMYKVKSKKSDVTFVARGKNTLTKLYTSKEWTDIPSVCTVQLQVQRFSTTGKNTCVQLVILQ